MNPEKDREFDQNMTQLIGLLKKLLKSVPQGGFPSFSKEKEAGINFNIFFTFLPLAPEEMDEFEEIYDQYLYQDERPAEELSSELNQADLDFLRRNGIRF